MGKNKTFRFSINKISLLILFFYCSNIAQWEWGAGYAIKNQYPFRGFNIFLERKLPVQAADFGINLRGSLEYYSKGEQLSTDKSLSYLKIHNTIIDLNLMVNFFFRYIQPYFGLGAGTVNYFAERFESLNDNVFNSNRDSWKFLGKLSGGMKFLISDQLRPFVQINLLKFFGSPAETEFDRKISSAQLGGIAGLSFAF